MPEATGNQTSDPLQSHLPGALQSCGVVLVVRVDTGCVTHASANSQLLMDRDPLDLIGRPLSDVLNAADIEELENADERRPQDPIPPSLDVELVTLSGQPRRVRCLAHTKGAFLYVEIFAKASLSPLEQGGDSFDPGNVLELESAETPDKVVSAATRILRRVTGFERSFCYRFDGGNGSSGAETGAHPITTSTDGINPLAVRAAFAHQTSRLIADTHAPPVPLVSEAGSEPIPDMSHLLLVAAPGENALAFGNPDASATLGTALFLSGKLWGLLVCQNPSPVEPDPARIRQVEAIARITGLCLQRSLRMAAEARRQEVLAMTGTLMQAHRCGSTSDKACLADISETLTKFFEVDVVAAKTGGTWHGPADFPEGAMDPAPLHALCKNGVLTMRDPLERPSEARPTDVAAGAFLSIDAEHGDYFFLARRKKPTAAGSTGPDGAHNETLASDPDVRQSQAFSDQDIVAFETCVPALRCLLMTRRAKTLEHANQRLEAAQAGLRSQILSTARSASLGELAAAIAHELNQPLTSITNFVSASTRLLKSDKETDQDMVLELMSGAATEAQRAGNVVSHLRNLMRPGYEDLTEIDPGNLVSTAARLSLSSVTHPGVKLRVLANPGLPRLSADKVQIEQVVFNLVRNAIQAMAMRTRRELDIRIEAAPGDMVRFSFEDTGIGLDEDQLDNLFHPVDPAKTGGMGIGLSLSRAAIEAHSGRIWAERMSHGARFCFELPANPPDTPHD